MNQNANWPILDFYVMQDTIETLHQWIQIVGKVRMKTMPWQNHSWHVPLYINTRGMTTNPIPYDGRIFHIDFDFKDHKLYIECSNAGGRSMELKPMTVAHFYEQLFILLKELGIEVNIYAKPNEIEPAIPFAENTVNKSYNKEHIEAIWKSFLKANEVFNAFRSFFIGKASPVHLFWGSFDLAVTRFSGEDAPLYQGSLPNVPMDVMQEAYSKEVSSAGFWLGSEDFPHAAFYSYAYPSNEEFQNQDIQPEKAYWHNDLGEFILEYDDMLSYDHPDQVLMSFLQSTYDAAAKTSEWDRNNLETDNPDYFGRINE